ncbi:MAG: hypothetical protein SO158_03100, partial [Bacteroidaceae bacterium]|nr:hypothetical protein [Bacteroidaceae bacterium]
LYKRLHANAFAPSGRALSLHHTQGDALGYVLVAPSGRSLNACATQNHPIILRNSLIIIVRHLMANKSDEVKWLFRC